VPRKAQKAVSAGHRALAEQSRPIIDGSLVCYQPGLRGSMTARIVNDLWDIGEWDYAYTSLK